MNNIPYGFQSPVFAQRKLLENFTSKKQHGGNCDIIEENPRINTMTSIATVPSLNKALAAPKSYEPELKAFSSRAYKRAYEKYLNSDSGRETLSKAIKYNIPFDNNDIDFLDFIYRIAEYECLLEKAAELDIEWDQSNYDTVELQREIEATARNSEHLTIDDNHQHRRDYYASIAL